MNVWTCHNIYWVRYLTFFSTSAWMVTLSSCLIWQIISFILPSNEYGCVYASLSGLNEFLFTKIEEDISNIRFQQNGGTCYTAEAILDVLLTVFEDRIISRRANVVWPPRSCDLTSLNYYLWGAVKDKCYDDKPETIDALKDNIREAIGEIQLYTIDVPKNWTDRVGYCMASRKDCTLRKYSVVFF